MNPENYEIHRLKGEFESLRLLLDDYEKDMAIYNVKMDALEEENKKIKALLIKLQVHLMDGHDCDALYREINKVLK